MTDVPDLVRVAIIAPIGNSDHSSLSAVISMAQAVPNLCVNKKVYLKHHVNWNTVGGALQDLPWRNIWSADYPVEVLNEHLPCWLDVMYQPRSSVCVTRINLGLMISAGVLLTLNRRLIFGGLVIALGLIGKSLSTVKLELMKPTLGRGVSLVLETGICLSTPSPPISGGPL